MRFWKSLSAQHPAIDQQASLTRGAGGVAPESEAVILAALDAIERSAYGSVVVGEDPVSKKIAQVANALQKRDQELLSRLVSLIVRRRITDPTSGFRAAGRRAIAFFARHYPLLAIAE